jgi:excisionase family DNA binding protein
MKRYLSVSQAAALLGVHAATLRRWEAGGRIRSTRINSRGDRRFAMEDLQALAGDNTPREAGVRAAAYVRVSGRGDQLTSLTAQEEELRNAAARSWVEIVRVFSDVGSGLSERRRGLAGLLRAARAGEFTRVLVTHEDRLARFGVHWLRELLDASRVELMVLHEKASGSAESELVADFVALVASFSGRLYGQRSAAARQRLLARVGVEDRPAA